MSDERFHMANRLLFRMFKATNLMHVTGTAWTASLKLTTQQWSVLGALASPGYENGLTVNELAEYLFVSRQNVNGLLDRLEQAGLTERVQKASDRRVRLVRLTKGGAKLWSTLTNEIRTYYEAALKGFSNEEIVQFQYLTDRLMANMLQIRESNVRKANDKTSPEAQP
ncbi:MAG: MarR family transcriptional regulator [Pseudomonadota bacterium]